MVPGMDDVRTTLLGLAEGAGQSLSELSRMLRRNPAYLQQFIHRGTPRRLAEDDRRLLAQHFGVDEMVLGGAAAAEMVSVPFLAVRAAAGSGIAAQDSRIVRAETFAPSLLREIGVAPRHAVLVTAAGESMVPTILHGDRLLVDRGETSLRDEAICVFRRDDAVSVKRLAWVGGRLRLGSDNPDYPSDLADPREVAVIGRVRLLLRRPE